MGGDLPTPPHSRLNLGLILATAASFLLMIIFNGLSDFLIGSGAGVGSVFIATVGNISDKYQLYITPAGKNQQYEAYDLFDIRLNSISCLCRLHLQHLVRDIPVAGLIRGAAVGLLVPPDRVRPALPQPGGGHPALLRHPHTHLPSQHLLDLHLGQVSSVV